MRLLSDQDVLPYMTQLSTTSTGAREVPVDAARDLAASVYLALTDGRLGADLSPEDRFYNRYYWFRRFANLHQARFGADAGIEQQAFQILEHADCEVDWSQVEQLDAAARTAH